MSLGSTARRRRVAIAVAVGLLSLLAALRAGAEVAEQASDRAPAEGGTAAATFVLLVLPVLILAAAGLVYLATRRPESRG